MLSLANGEEKFSYTLWFTGLPKSGKDAIASQLIEGLRDTKIPVVYLQEEELKKTLSYDLGTKGFDRERHTLRMIHMCYHITANGVLNVVSSVSAKRKMRNYARSLIKNFVEIYVKCSVDTCIKRDNDTYFNSINLETYNNLIGVDIPYEEPFKPHITLDTEKQTIDENIEKLIKYLKKRKII